MARTIDLDDATVTLSQLVAAIAETGDHVEILRDDRPIAIIVSAQDWQALHETIAVLSDEQLVIDIRAAEEDIRAGRTCRADDLRHALLARLGARAPR